MKIKDISIHKIEPGMRLVYKPPYDDEEGCTGEITKIDVEKDLVYYKMLSHPYSRMIGQEVFFKYEKFDDNTELIIKIEGLEL